ncbi:hypothetical protein ACFL6K_03740 [Candidatus Latescibacterota bacterium]
MKKKNISLQCVGVLSAIIILMCIFTGCAPKVIFPPAVDLAYFESVGLIGFTSNTEGSLSEYATQQFIASITNSQHEAVIIELGDMETVLESVDSNSLSLDAIKAIGEKYDVSAIITGSLDISEVKPKLNIFFGLGMKANVSASLVVKLYETTPGATIWAATGEDVKTVAEVTVFQGGGFHFDARDPEEAYGDLVKSLIRDVTRDLRVSSP